MEQGARALQFESRAWAGGYLDLDISAVILSHQGLQGYGYKVHNHHPVIYLWETGLRKVRKPLTYICSTPVSARSPGTISAESSSMMVSNKGVALGALNFDGKNRPPA